MEAIAVDPIVFRLTIFVLAIFIGYFVVWAVTPALHTPLMSVTNAISSVIVVGALIAVAVSTHPKAADAAVSTDQRSVVSVQNALSSPPVSAPDEVAASSVSSATEDAGTLMTRHAWTSKLLGFVALILACVNIFGGFLVTARMLAMYKKKGREVMDASLKVDLAALLYLVSGVLFILALRGLSSPATSRAGNRNGMIGMAIAVATTLWVAGVTDPLTWGLIAGGIAIGGGIGAVTARRIHMTDMPQLVAAFHSLVGLAAVLVAAAAFYSPEAYGIGAEGAIRTQSLIEMSLGTAIGAITFAGSIIAFAKLNGNMSGAPILLPARHLLNIAIALGIVALIVILVLQQPVWAFWAIAVLSFVFGITLIIPIGGADMPVVVSMLNSYSGWAAAAMGFTLENTALIITGALVGSSGAILSYIMCKGMNRSFVSVILGGFGGETGGPKGPAETRPVKQGSADDAAFIMKNAGSVIIVPGYGMAVAQAQHAVREMADILKKEGVKVSYAIHPVAGRMPGHMNVLLAEANVPYDEVFELEDINSQFAQADVAYVIGANDVTNPSAKTDPKSPIYGMPILDVEKAKTVLFIKRGMGSGYAGVENELFFRDNTMMLFGDAKKMTEEIVKALG